MRISDGSSDVFSSDLRAEFETLMYQNYKQAGANSDQTNQYATGLNIGTGVKVVGTERINTQGAMQATDNPTDMAINGQGFFQVQKPDGSTAYTRDGSFSVSSEGRLVTNDGYPLQPDINIPEGAQSSSEEHTSELQSLMRISYDFFFL